jgi:hypothetical protein
VRCASNVYVSIVYSLSALHPSMSRCDVFNHYGCKNKRFQRTTVHYRIAIPVTTLCYRRIHHNTGLIHFNTSRTWGRVVSTARYRSALYILLQTATPMYSTIHPGLMSYTDYTYGTGVSTLHHKRLQESTVAIYQYCTLRVATGG